MATQTVEINGIKFEVNMDGARKVQELRVGSRVKVLVKDYYGYKAHPGAIVGVDMFQALPTVVVAYVPVEGGLDADVKFAYLNAQTKDIEVAPMVEDDLIPTRETILGQFERAIANKQNEIAALMAKREYFLRRFGSALVAEPVNAT